MSHSNKNNVLHTSNVPNTSALFHQTVGLIPSLVLCKPVQTRHPQTVLVCTDTFASLTISEAKMEKHIFNNSQR